MLLDLFGVAYVMALRLNRRSFVNDSVSWKTYVIDIPGKCFLATSSRWLSDKFEIEASPGLVSVRLAAGSHRMMYISWQARGGVRL
jgi:hypothetical protein